MFHKIVLIYLVFVIVQKTTIAEWVEVPQFSDNNRVYRIPFTKYDRGHKHSLDNRDGPKINGYGNASGADEHFREKFKQPHGVLATTVSALNVIETSEIFTTPKSLFAADSTRVIITNARVKGDQSGGVETEEEPSVTVPTTYSNDKIILEGDQPFEASFDKTEENISEPEVDDTEKKHSFMTFIPIELFRKVHAILQSQSTSVEGKIHFLQNFEKTLLSEIENRLVPVFNPVRKKRESRGDHGWDDHEKGVAFPSLEGALMTIAFLTFAVYLVQLVMLLFRNLGNNGTNTGTATVLFNRNRRSTDQLTEDTARILEYLEEFAKKKNSQ
ncbi:uncharacterized protein [Venturia canescens]|uniref:uncharacterized protein isoform X2 n=1 Tax=Venturia canescens TaxID=32260 RepID=UPI001C9D2A1E|nr:uncharacterized protein LOC122411512 isoform X2 [Venturia canescens]